MLKSHLKQQPQFEMASHLRIYSMDYFVCLIVLKVEANNCRVLVLYLGQI